MCKKSKIIQSFAILGLVLFFAVFLHCGAGPVIVQAAQVNNTEKTPINNPRLNINKVSIVRDKTFSLKVYNLNNTARISFKSDNPEIASVDSDGLITAKNVGTTTIIATIRDGSRTTNLECDVTVGPPAFSVTMTRSRIILGPKDVSQLRVILKPSNTVEDAKFSSNDSSIASVSTGGRITARQLGFTYLFAEIDALYFNGIRKFASSCLIITEFPSEVRAYLNDHPELDMLSTVELNNALEEFFTAEAEKASSNTNSNSNDLINRLDKFLNENFDNLDELRELRNQVIARTVSYR